VAETTPETRKHIARVAAVAAGLALGAAIVLSAMGHTLWCKCGSPVPWAFDVWSMHNSQHLFDPYSFTHVLHGLAFYAVMWAATAGGRVVPVRWRAILAATLEAGWEILENSPVVINRYREATISLDYFGDSVLNSMSDITMCMLGFYIAWKLPWKASLAFFVITEIVLLLWVHDSLIVNILQLVHPSEAIKQWQMGAAGAG
jgi:hypothetical protein